MNNEKIKEIEDFSKGMWLNYGCKVAKEIPNRQFLMIKTSHANSILNGLSLSGIQFSAKYDECCSPRKIRKTQKCGITRN